MKTLLILVTVLAATTARSYGPAGRADWGYGDTNGPDTWPDTYPTCGGLKQSPVALFNDQALLNTSWAPFEFTNYDVVPPLMAVTNNGHAVKVTANIDAFISGGNLAERYVFSQFHLHWGSHDTQGSEHVVEGLSFPAELHIVHYMESYGSMDEAILHQNGLAVLGVLLEDSLEDNPAIQAIVDRLSAVTNPGESASITPFALLDLLPSDPDSYFRYEGSLTTPTCDEVVVWTVFKNTISISKSQLHDFRRVLASDGSFLQDNFRPPQPLNDRQVYKSSM